MDGLPAQVEVVGSRVLDAAFRVHRALGPGHLESVYRRCLAHALRTDGADVQEEVWLPLEFEGLLVPRAFRADLIVQECVLVEVKAVEDLHPVHGAQVVSYLKWSGVPLGFLLNFHSPALRHGLRRFVNRRR